MTDLIRNYNDHFSYGHAYNKTYRGYDSPKEGVIVNVTRENHLAQTYDVQLLVSSALIKGCRLLSTNGGFNGVGQQKALEENTPVLVIFNDGNLQEGYIIGVFYLEGSNKDYYNQGKLQAPGDLLQGAEFNQTSGHPNRIVQPDSYFNIVGGKNLAGDYTSPEYTSTLEDKAKNNTLPSSIEMRNPLGDIVNYSSGSNVTYADSNIVSISGGTNESKQNKLLRFAAYHNKRSQLFSNQTVALPTNPPQKTTSGLVPIVVTNNPNQIPSLGSPFTLDYFSKQEKILADLYLKQSQTANQATAARTSVAGQLQQLGSTLPSTNPTATANNATGKVVAPSYTPNSTNAPVNANNYGDRINPTHKPLLVLHEIDGTADSAVSLFQNPSLPAPVSYHVIIKLTGDLIYLVDPTKRAYGAAPSQFNGEYEVTRVGGKHSVNNFAYHVSFETPVDGQPPNDTNPTHSGYTDAQYNSAAWLAARTGIPLERITTHKYVDIGQGKIDPRSWDQTKFNQIYNNYPKTKDITFGIPGENDYINSLGTTTQ